MFLNALQSITKIQGVRLLPFQKEAIKFVTEKAKDLHEKALPKLKERAKELGFAVAVVERCLEYIKDKAPIVISFKLALLDRLLIDTHYTNFYASEKKEDVAAKEKALFGNSYAGLFAC